MSKTSTPSDQPDLAENINGPSLVRMPDWAEGRLGRYHLYFADHKGSYIRLAYADALTEQDLRPAGEPVIDPVEAKKGEGLKFTAAFEVFPDVALGPVEELTIERAVCEINDADVDKMVETEPTMS